MGPLCVKLLATGLSFGFCHLSATVSFAYSNHCNNLWWGNALSTKLEVMKRHSVASYHTLTTGGGNKNQNGYVSLFQYARMNPHAPSLCISNCGKSTATLRQPILWDVIGCDWLMSLLPDTSYRGLVLMRVQGLHGGGRFLTYCTYKTTRCGVFYQTVSRQPDDNLLICFTRVHWCH